MIESIDSLVLETTRHCNMKCAHCLRGAARREQMPQETLYKLFRQLRGVYVGDIMFSGGEPTLRPDIVRDVRHNMHRFGCWGFCSVMTNGKIHRRSREFLQEFALLRGLCEEPDLCSIQISNDIWHDCSKRLQYMAEDLGYEFVSLSDYRNDRYDSLIDQGRAHDNQMASGRQQGDSAISMAYNHLDGSLYVNARGELIAGCDWSYRNQGAHRICTVDDDILEELERYAETTYPQTQEKAVSHYFV